MRIPWRKALEDVTGERFATVEAAVENAEVRAILLDSVQPACCDEGCEVEPDGMCEHGGPGLSMAMGLV
jgi:hypothetical protein